MKQITSRISVSLLLCLGMFLFASDSSEYEQGKLDYLHGSYESAWSHFNQIPTTSPLFAYSVHYASNIALRLKKYSEGITLNLFPLSDKDLPYLEKRKGNDLQLRYYSGSMMNTTQLFDCAKVFMNSYQYGNALTCFSRLPTPSLEASDVKRLLARSLGGGGQKEKAKQLWDSLPDSAEKIYYLSTLTTTDDVKYEFYEQLLKQFPGTNFANDSAFSLLQYYKKKSATENIVNVLSYLENSAPYHLRGLFEKGLLFYELGNYALAMQYFQQAEAGDFKDAALYWQGKVFEKTGNDDLSKKTWLRLQNTYPLSYYSYRAFYYTMYIPPFHFESYPPPSFPPELQYPDRLQALLDAHQYDDAFYEFKTFLSDRPDIRNKLLHDMLTREEYFYVFRLANTLPANYFWLYPAAYYQNIQGHVSGDVLDPYLVEGLMREESNFDTFSVSSSGARGLMQLMPFVSDDIAKRLKMDPYDSFIPSDNIRMGVTHLKYDVKSLGVIKGVAAYNCGIGAAGRMRNFDDIDLWAENIPIVETNYYVKKVLRSYWVYKLLYDRDSKNPIQF